MCLQALAAEVKARNERQTQLLAKEEAAVTMRFALDTAEAELVRLQTIIDNVARMHPHTVRKMLSMDPAKGFIDRGLTKFTQALSAHRTLPLVVKNGNDEMEDEAPGDGSQAPAYVDDLLTGLDVTALPELTLMQAIANINNFAQPAPKPIQHRYGLPPGEEGGPYRHEDQPIGSQDATADVAPDQDVEDVAAVVVDPVGAGGADEGQAGAGTADGDGEGDVDPEAAAAEAKAAEEAAARLRELAAIKRNRGRSWSVDMGQVRHVTRSTHRLRRHERVHHPDADDDGISQAVRRGSVALDDGTLLAAAGRSGMARRASRTSLAASDSGEDSDDSDWHPKLKHASDMMQKLPAITWISAEDALVVRRFKQVQLLIQETNIAKDRMARSIAKVAARRARRKLEAKRERQRRRAIERAQRHLEMQMNRLYGVDETEGADGDEAKAEGGSDGGSMRDGSQAASDTADTADDPDESDSSDSDEELDEVGTRLAVWSQPRVDALCMRWWGAIGLDRPSARKSLCRQEARHCTCRPLRGKPPLCRPCWRSSCRTASHGTCQRRGRLSSSDGPRSGRTSWMDAACL